MSHVNEASCTRCEGTGQRGLVSDPQCVDCEFCGGSGSRITQLEAQVERSDAELRRVMDNAAASLKAVNDERDALRERLEKAEGELEALRNECGNLRLFDGDGSSPCRLPVGHPPPCEHAESDARDRDAMAQAQQYDHHAIGCLKDDIEELTAAGSALALALQRCEPLFSGCDGDEESGKHDPKCLACEMSAALARWRARS